MLELGIFSQEENSTINFQFSNGSENNTYVYMHICKCVHVYVCVYRNNCGKMLIIGKSELSI